MFLDTNKSTKNPNPIQDPSGAEEKERKATYVGLPTYVLSIFSFRAPCPILATFCYHVFGRFSVRRR
jgi:hypothetical protein